MALQATYIRDRKCDALVLAAARNAGDVVQLGDNRAGVIQGSRAFAIGETVSVETEGIYEIATASGTTFSAGDPVEWDDTNKLVVAAAGGDFDLGRAVKAKVSGELVTLVSLNTTNF